MDYFLDLNDTILCYKKSAEILLCNGTEYDVHIPPLTFRDSDFWIYFTIYVALTLGAGLMSGLTLGLLSLDTLTLEVLMRAGYGKEALYAEKLYPIIKQHHILLVTLLLGNAACVESMPIFLDRISDPITAIIVSVTAVLIFGEIIPQALCKRYGLAIGYYMRPLVYLIMALFLVFSYPIAKLLDCIFGHENATYYQRSQLKALIDLHGPSKLIIKNEHNGNEDEKIKSLPSSHNGDSHDNDNQALSLEEVTIIKGALDLTMMTAKDAQVPLEKVFMISDDDILDVALMAKLVQTAHSRVPIYCGNEPRLVRGILITKMLIQVDPSEAVPIDTLIKNPNFFRKLSYVTETTPLYDLLQLFKTGRTSHMAVVVKDDIELEELDALDRFYACREQNKRSLVTVFPPVTGIITLEDVIEKLIQADIQDEGDIYRETNMSRRMLEKQKLRRARNTASEHKRSRSHNREARKKNKSDGQGFTGYFTSIGTTYEETTEITPLSDESRTKSDQKYQSFLPI